MKHAALRLACLLLAVWTASCAGDVVTGTGGSGGAGVGGSGSGTGGAGDRPVGAPCAAAADCAAPETCVTMVPGGYCSVVIPECPAEGGTGGVCPVGSTCVNGIVFGGQIGDYCLAACAGDADCRTAEGYACCPWDMAGVCALKCL